MKTYTELELAALRLADDEPCHYDHHGYCQSHFLHSSPCPMEIINREDKIKGLEDLK